MFKKITDFFSEGIWIIQENSLNPLQFWAVKMCRILLLSLQGFIKDLCPLRASALTLYTLLSIVPVIALLFGIAKGFGFEKKLRQHLLENISEQDDMMVRLIEFSQNMLANTQGGVVAGIGIVLLFWTVIKVIGNIEESFNHIWKIRHNRTLARKLTDYLSIMMLAPVLMIVSGSITVFVKTQLTWLMQVIHLPAFGTRIVLYALNYSPLVIMGLLFTFIFMFMPNRKIEFKAGLIAGIFTGLMYQCVQWAYLTLQLGASSYNAIYGSFAALPLFLIWLQLGWFVVLLGCEMSFYIQNYASYCHNNKFSEISISLKLAIALQIMHAIVQRFSAGDKPMNPDEISRRLNLPMSVVQSSLAALLDSGLIVELKTPDDETVIYQPAFDIHRMTVGTVIETIETNGRNALPKTQHLEQFVALSRDFHGRRDCLLTEIEA